jgi:hypothetical protein
MKTLFVFASLIAVSPAYARPSTVQMNCAEAASLVSSKGAVVLSTGTYTYDRFVAHEGFCLLAEDAAPAWVPTQDDAQCFIGYTCDQSN